MNLFIIVVVLSRIPDDIRAVHHQQCEGATVAFNASVEVAA